MTTPLDRIRRGAVVLTIIVVVAIVGYRYLDDRSWLDAAYMATITISSVGFGEQSVSQPLTQAFTIMVIVLGMSSAAYTISGLVQFITEGEIDRILGTRRMTRDIERLTDHVIICGYGRIGQILAERLARRDCPFLVIDADPERIEDAKSQNCLCIPGDATEEELLLKASVKKARTLVTSLPNDAANVFITLTARNLNEKLQIIARAEFQSSEKKLRQAGANRVVMPAAIGAQNIARIIMKPSTADLIELVAESKLDVEFDEIYVKPSSQLVGISIRESAAHQKHRILVIALKKPGEDMIFNPSADYRFEADDIVILMGRIDDIHRFQRRFIA